MPVRPAHALTLRDEVADGRVVAVEERRHVIGEHALRGGAAARRVLEP